MTHIHEPLYLPRPNSGITAGVGSDTVGFRRKEPPRKLTSIFPKPRAHAASTQPTCYVPRRSSTAQADIFSDLHAAIISYLVLERFTTVFWAGFPTWQQADSVFWNSAIVLSPVKSDHWTLTTDFFCPINASPLENRRANK